MKYFTRYLPVEGEIKAGDKYIRKNAPQWGVSIACACPDQILWKKVQLFLCSRDIQVGDSYHFDVGYASGEKVADQEDVTQLHLENNPFKVIGPISPKATWVKEGDEFEEDQVQEWFWHKNQKAFMFRADEEWVPKFLEISKDKDWYERGHYMIKGPCGYFH